MILNLLRESVQQGVEDVGSKWLQGGFGESLTLKVRKILGVRVVPSRPCILASWGMHMKQGSLKASVPV